MSQIRLWTMALAWSTLAVTAVIAQSPPGQQSGTTATTSTGLILGRTVNAVTGAPLGGVVVTIGTTPPPAGSVTPLAPATTLGRFPVRVLSDATGQFVFRDLPKGSYTITGSKPGFADSGFGRRSPGETSSQALLLVDGEKRSDVTIPFWKAGSISGTVLDEAGEPAIGVQVRAFRRAIVAGRVKYVVIGNTTNTDDRGVYRIASLQAGDYVVGVVTTQTTVPTSLASAFQAASTAGNGQEFQRELDRSYGLQGSFIGIAFGGQRVGSWQLQAPMSIGIGPRTMPAPPIDHGKVFVYPTTYYPGVPSTAQASSISLAAGGERNGVDLQVHPVVASQISGVLTGLQGPERFTALDLIPVSADAMQRDYDMAAASTLTDATGAFTFLGVPPGNYVIRTLKMPLRPPPPPSSMTTVIQTGSSTISSGGGPTAQPPIPDDPTLWASVPIAVEDRDVSGVSVALAPGARLSGRLEFDGTADKPTPTELRLLTVTVDQADARTTSSNQFLLGRGVVDANGEFKTYQLPPGRYVVRAGGLVAPGWTFKGATFDGRDISDAPLDLGSKDVSDIVVTFTDHPSELTGVVRDTKGPVTSATVIVFPRQPARWTDEGVTPRRLRTARVASDGTYRFVNLPADEYLVVALDGALPQDWQDPKFLEKLTTLASSVSLGDGAKKALDVEPKQVR